MTQVSLSAAIFGERKDTEGSLSNLFNSSSTTLQAPPNNVNFPETAEKKKKRKAKDDGGDSKPNEVQEGRSGRKQRKPKSTKDDVVVENQGGTNEDVGVSNDEDECTIFVGNLPLDVTRKQLESMFKECGKVKSSRLRSVGTTGVKVAPEHAGNQVRL